MKLNWFHFAENSGLVNLVDVGFWLLPIMSEICVAYIFAFQQQRIKNMLTSLVSITCADNTSIAKQELVTRSDAPGIHRMNQKITILICLSFLVCAIKTETSQGLKSPDDVLLEKSNILANGIQIWSTDEFFNANLTQPIFKTYGQEINWSTMMMGSMATAMELFSNIKLEVTMDLIIVTSHCLSIMIKKNAKKVLGINFEELCADGNDCAKLGDPDGLWSDYQQLKLANKAINNVLENLLKIMHLYNTMQCSYFLMHVLDNNLSSMKFIFMFYNICKLSLAYYIAKKSHSFVRYLM